jgi:hypothetical protein
VPSVRSEGGKRASYDLRPYVVTGSNGARLRGALLLSCIRVHAANRERVPVGTAIARVGIERRREDTPRYTE